MDDFMKYRKMPEEAGLIYPKEEEDVRAWMYKLDKFARNELFRFDIEVENMSSVGGVEFRPDDLRRLAELSGFSVEESQWYEWYEDSWRVLRLVTDRGYDFWAIEYEKKEVDDVRDTNERQ